MSERNGDPREVIRVPEPDVVDSGSGDDRFDDMEEVLVSPEDIGSASRSCLAIIIMLLVITLLICLFLLAQPFID